MTIHIPRDYVNEDCGSRETTLDNYKYVFNMRQTIRTGCMEKISWSKEHG